MNDLNRIRRLAGLMESAPVQKSQSALAFVEERIHKFFPYDPNGASALTSIARSLVADPQVSNKLMMSAIVALIRRYRGSKQGQADVMRIVMRLGAGGRINPETLQALIAPAAQPAASQKTTGDI